MSAEIKAVENIELGEHLFGIFVPLLAALILDDVAEFAIEWTSARVLYAPDEARSIDRDPTAAAAANE